MVKTKIIKTVPEMISWRNQQLSQFKQSIGFVPTMGALHDGHASLLKKAREENDLCVLSLFVNPTQFNNSTDLEKYPKTFEQDYQMACDNNVDILFYPAYNDIYPDQYRYQVTENDFSKRLCGAHRPGHFNGVLTVVLKLLQITGAHRSYFGLKDYQQYKLIQDMVKSLFLPVEIIGLPTIRENTGLAMSSRNLRLSEQGRIKASLIYKTIVSQSNPMEAHKILSENGFEVEYLEDIENRRYIAAHLEGVRLIDNVEI